MLISCTGHILPYPLHNLGNTIDYFMNWAKLPTHFMNWAISQIGCNILFVYMNMSVSLERTVLDANISSRAL